jgi:hypothetical protein
MFMYVYYRINILLEYKCSYSDVQVHVYNFSLYNLVLYLKCKHQETEKCTVYMFGIYSPWRKLIVIMIDDEF